MAHNDTGLKDSNPKWEGLEYDHRFKKLNYEKSKIRRTKENKKPLRINDFKIGVCRI